MSSDLAEKTSQEVQTEQNIAEVLVRVCGRSTRSGDTFLVVLSYTKGKVAQANKQQQKITGQRKEGACEFLPV